MIVMVSVGSWSMEQVSTVGIVHIVYRMNFIFGLNFRPGLKFSRPVWTGRLHSLARGLEEQGME